MDLRQIEDDFDLKDAIMRYRKQDSADRSATIIATVFAAVLIAASTITAWLLYRF